VLQILVVTYLKQSVQILLSLIATPGMPESFNVLVKEIRSLGIDIELETE